MKWSLRVLSFALLLMGVLSIVFTHPAAAETTSTSASATSSSDADAEGFNIITSPLPTKITTSPGKTVTTELRLKNQGSQSEGIKVGLMKFGATGSVGEPDLFALTPQDTYANWVTFSPSEFTAQPNVWVTVQVTIKVPATASLGYYLAVTFSRASQAGQVEATNLHGAVASLVLLEVKTPNEQRSLQLTDFTSDHDLYEYLPVNFSVKLHNNGNIFLSPVGNIFITRGNKAISTIDFNDVGASVLPNSNRVINLSWSDGFPVYVERLVDGKPVPGKNDIPKENLKWDFTQVTKFRFGKYTAKLLVVYDNGTVDVPLESTLSFWVIPWKMLSVILIILILVGFGIFTLVRSIIRKAKSGVGKVRHHG